MIFDEENVTRITVGTPICTIIVLLLCTCAFAARYRTPGFDSAWKAVELSADIPAGGEKVWILPALPQRSDMVAVIRFHAVLKAQEGAMSSHENTNIDPAQRMVFQGSKNFLSMKWNGSPVLANIGNLPSGLPRLLNYSMRNFLTDSETADSYFKENRLAVPLAGMPAAKNRDADEVGWYMIEVSDLVSSAKTGTLAENKLVLGNTSHAGAMEISSVEAGCLPAKVVAEFPMRARLSNSAEQINPKAVLKGKGFAVALASAGGLVLNHAGESYSVDSGFSYPYMPNDGWNSLSVSNTPSRTSEWKITAETSKDALSITGTGKHYRLVRRVFVVGDHAVVEDTLTNLTSEPLGIAFDNRVTPTGVPRAINVCGPYKKTYMPYNPSNQVGNLTIYLAGEKQGLGMLAVDDYYQLQLTMLAEGKTGVFRNVNFGLPGKDSYTFKWALYPTEKSDYYEFINKARRDLLPPRTIEGSVAMFCYSLALDWPKKKVADWLKQRGAKAVILFGPYSGGPWLGEDSNHLYKIPNFKIEEYLATLKKVVQTIKSIDPSIKCLAPFETPLSPDMAAGDFTPKFPDSTAIMSNGLPRGYGMPSEAAAWKAFAQKNAHQFVYYWTPSNSYYAWCKERILRALNETGVDGIYFDCFSYAGSYTYDKWDNRTVEMVMSNYTISRKKADLCMLSEDGRVAMVKMILNHKKGNIVVVNGMISGSKIRALPIFHFNETIEDYGYVENHLSTPLVLGYSPGYQSGAEYIGKAGTWWKQWKTDSDYFQDVKDKLQNGCLYYTYDAPGGYYSTFLTRATLLSYMFPITVEELHAGWIKGKERILTLYPGTYSWGDKTAVECHFYDASGKECEGTVQTIHDKDGCNSFKVSFPQGGAAAIVKQR